MKTRILLIAALLVAGVVGIRFWNRHKPISAPDQSERSVVLSEMERRPTSDWPRGAGHVVLALPGSRFEDKGYHEPGGGFSPGVGSFGVSFVVREAGGNIAWTSESLDLTRLTQAFDWDSTSVVPHIATETPAYRVAWEVTTAGWNLEVIPKTEQRIELVIRSVGPAGGPLRSIAWTTPELTINDRWRVQLSPAPVNVTLGEEDRDSWRPASGRPGRVESKSGWASARLSLEPARSHVAITDSSPRPEPLAIPTAFSWRIDAPDHRFQQSLSAQIAHLLMGLVGDETRPGDPVTYPLAWLRDGAYTVVALDRAGLEDVAQRLLPAFAERDFFGGFGPEADAPGLALWAIGEVSARHPDATRDRWLWPHVYRKVRLILEMLESNQDLHVRVPDGPLLPDLPEGDDPTLLAEPAHDGLIVGRMDQHRPVLYVNAVSYLGLTEASAIAERLGHADEAARWRHRATILREAWSRALPGLPDNDRTFNSALWPSMIAMSDRPALASRLRRRWEDKHDASGAYKSRPKWTYFEIGEAHQWLYLDRPEPAWTTLEWFWNHQASTGLWTWWEGSGDGDPFGTWHQVRGWVKPPHVTPHYWTAAETALLQMDMMAATEETPVGPGLLLGGGVPRSWMASPIAVSNLGIAAHVVSWEWDGREVRASVRGSRVPIRLGPSFAAGTPLKVTFVP